MDAGETERVRASHCGILQTRAASCSVSVPLYQPEPSTEQDINPLPADTTCSHWAALCGSHTCSHCTVVEDAAASGAGEGPRVVGSGGESSPQPADPIQGYTLSSTRTHALLFPSAAPATPCRAVPGYPKGAAAWGQLWAGKEQEVFATGLCGGT